MTKYLTIILVAVFCFAFYSFIGRYNNQSGDLISVKHVDFQKTKLPKELKPILGELVYVPSGTFISGLELDGKVISIERQITVASFYLGKTEVTNAQYKLFCKEMITLVGKDSAMKLLPDTTTFKKDIVGSMDAYVNYYFSHVTYQDYPVIGVNWHQANAYCEWLTKKLQELYKSHPEWQDKYPFAGIHLPSEMEWEYAALGNYLRNGRSCPYSWGYELQESKNDKLVWKGNFGSIKDKDGVIIKDIAYAENLSDEGFLTSKAISFSPNDYGLYNLSGNVNEWVMDVYRPTDKVTDDLNPRRDTVFHGDHFHVQDVKTVNERVIKGGGFLDGPAYCLISNRRPMDPNTARCDVGFRISMICVGSDKK